MPRSETLLAPLNDTRKLLEHWRTAGLPEDVAVMIEAATARRRALPGEARAESSDADRDAIVREWARGEITAGEALARNAALTSAKTPEGRSLVRMTARQILEDLANDLGSLPIVEEMLAPAYAELVDQAPKLAAKADGVTAENVLTAPKATREAWVELQLLEQRRAAIEGVYGRLTGIVIAAPERLPDWHPLVLVETFHRRPERLPVDADGRHRRQPLPETIALGAEPAVMTPAELLELRAQRDPKTTPPDKRTPDERLAERAVRHGFPEQPLSIEAEQRRADRRREAEEAERASRQFITGSGR